MTTGWLILVDQEKHLPNAETPHKVITTKDYLTRSDLLRGVRPKIVNLAKSYAYQGSGYYCSLLAEARGHRVMPSVETMLELSRPDLYAQALPELEDILNRAIAKGWQPPEANDKILVCFGQARENGLGGFSRLLFDWFRTPILQVQVAGGEWVRVKRIRPRALTDLKGEDRDFFRAALDDHTRRQWRDAKTRAPARYTIAVLHDPAEQLPPSQLSSLKYMAKVAAQMGVECEPITSKDLSRLAEFDALFIRETTNIDNHTYRFARRAVQEGMPVIDDPRSMMRCTNKVYLQELLTANGLPTPNTLVLDKANGIARVEAEIGYPVVLKIPDGSFSRGVKKAENRAELETLMRTMLAQSDLILAQEFLPTAFDWRIGVLDGEPLFACQYLMAKKHWQIVRHQDGQAPAEGSFKTFALDEAPADVVDVATRAARLIGHGLYGVDLKETDKGVVVIEINDNPNLEHGVEDAVGKDQIWRRLIGWFVERIERRSAA